MASRYLVIEFDEESAASSLRAQIDNATRKGKKFRVVGLFAKPGTPCSCAALPGDRAKDRVKRGGRLGWWVCTTCKKPRLGDHQLHNLITPQEVIDPQAVSGMDALYNLDVKDPKYVRHPLSLNIVTFPERVVKN